MAGNTDTRIVQMQFENRQFEKNIAKSKRSLDDLKAAMNFDETSRGLDRFAGSLDKLSFSNLEDNIQRLADKFTGLGTVSELVISQVRRKIEEAARAVSGFIDSMTTQQVSAGMDKYEMLNRSVQTIKAATGRDEADVYRVLERLNQYTDQTSYNFSDMAQNIGKFTSVGIELEDAERQMEGIANWAARSGAGINEASRAMYNLSQAMGVGKMTLIDWKSIENAGMATEEFKKQMIQAGIAAGTLVEDKGVIKTAKSLGKQIEVTYQNVSQTLNKGWATSGVISSTLEKYYYDDLYYENEQEAILQLNETQKKSFDEMMASGKALSASQYKTLKDMGVMTKDTEQKILDLAVSQNKLTKQTDKDGKTIYKTVNKTGKQIEFTVDSIEESLKAGWFDKGFGESVTSINELAKSSYEAAQKCMTFTDVLGAWKDSISTGWMQSFTYIFGELSESMEFFSNVCDRVSDMIKGLIDLRNGALEVWSGSGGRDSLLKIILGDYGSDIETGAFGFLDMIEGVKNLIGGAFKDFMMLFASDIDKNAIEQDPKYFATFLGYKLNNITNAIRDFMTGIRDFFGGEVEVNGQIKTRMQLIQETVMAISGAIRMAMEVVKGVVGFFSNLGGQLGDSFDAILDLLSMLGVTIYNTADETRKSGSIVKFFTGLADVLRPVTIAINFTVKTITNLLNALLTSGAATDAAKTLFGTIGDHIKRFFSYISNVAGPMVEFIGNLIGILRDLFKGGFGEENLVKSGQKLKDAAKKMFKSLPQSLQNFVNFFRKLYTNVKNVITNKFSPESMKQLSEQVSSAFGGIVEKIPDSLKTAGSTVWEKIKTFFTGLWEKITGLFKGGEEQGNAVEGIGKWISEKFGAIRDFISSALGNIGFPSGSFGSGIKKFFEGINLSQILLYVIGGLGITGIVILVAKVLKVVKTLGKALKTLTDILTGKKKIVPLKKMLGLEEAEETDFGDKLIKIAAAVAIFAGVVLVLGNMKLENALQGVGALVIILGALIGASFLLKKAYDGVDWQQAVGMLLGFVGMGYAVAKIAKAILPVANISREGFLKIIGTLVVIFGGLLLLAKMSKDGSMSFANMGGIIGVAAGIAILIFALKSIADMELDQLAKMFGSLFVIFGEMFLFILAVSKTNSGLAEKQLGQLALVALSVAILIFSLKSIAKLGLEDLGKMMGILTIILGELIGFVWAVQKADMSGKAMGQLAALAGAIAILMIAMVPLALLSWEQLGKAVAAVSVVMWELVGVTAVISKMNGLSGTALAQLIALAGAVFLISLTLIPLALLDFGKLMGAVLAVGIIMGLLIAMVAVAGKSKDAKASAMVGLLAVAGAIALLVLTLTPLAMMPLDGLIKMGASLLVVTAAMMLLLHKVAKVKASAVASTSLLMLVMSLMVLALGAVIKDLKDVDWKVIGAFTVGVAAIIGVIALALPALSKIDFVAGLKGIALLALAVGAIAAVIGLVLSLVGPMIINSFGNAIADLGGKLALFGSLIETFTGRMNGADDGGIEKAGSVIDKLIAMMKKLSDVRQYSGSISDFQTMMFQLGTAVEIFHNHTNTLGNMEDNAGFALIKGLASCANDLDTITKLPINDLQTKIAGLGGAMSIYASGVKNVDDAGGFDFEEGEIPDMTKAVALMSEITKAFNSENAHFEIPENMPEKQALTDFGVQLAALAGGMVEFEKAGRGIGDPKESNAIKTLEFFRDLQTQLRMEEGQLDFSVITEFENNMSTAGVNKDILDQFGADIEALGLALNKFAISTSNVDKTTGEIKGSINFSNATGALQSFIDMKEKLPTVGGALQWLIGEKESYTQLGSEIEAIATALSDLNIAMVGGTDSQGKEHAGFDKKSPGIAVDALKEMAKGFNEIDAEIKKLPEIPDTGDYDLATKEQRINALAREIAVIGPALNTLSESIIGNPDKGIQAFNPDCIEPTKVATEQMAVFLETIRDKLPKVGGLVNIADTFFNGREGNMNDLKQEMTWLGEGLNSLSTSIGSNFNSEGVGNAIESLKGFAEIMASMSNIPEGRIFDGYELLGELTNFLNGFIGMDAEGEAWFNRDTGAYVKPVEQLATAMSELSDLIIQKKVDKNAIEMFYQMAYAINELSHADLMKDFTGIGENIAKGIEQGIRNGEGLVLAAATDLIIIARDAARKAGIIKSPSRLFAEIGGYLTAGMAVGMNEESGLVEDASDNIIAASLSTITDQMKNVDEMLTNETGNLITAVSQALSEGIDANPTITPVLNLDQARAELGLFNDYLSRGNQLDVGLATGLAGRIGSLGGNPAASETNEVDLTGVYERMAAMNEQIATLGKSISQMKFVLDTGVIAGGVTDRVDELIGQKIWLINRGNTV